MSVRSPEEGGGWPVVSVLHGEGNDRDDMAGCSTALAREGLVVFVPDIRTAESGTAATDVECGDEEASGLRGQAEGCPLR